MYDLDRQLSDLASFIDGEVEAVTVSEVVTEKVLVAHRPRRAGLSLVFAVLVAVAIGFVIVVAPLGDQEPGVVDEPAPTVVSTTPTLPADPVVEPTVPQDKEGDAPAYTWTRVDDPDLGGEGNQSINSIRALRSGLMAVGSDNDQPAIWYSDDGLDWTRLEDTTGAFGSEYSAYGDESVMWLTDIADDGSRLVAVGVDLLDRPGVSGVDNPKVSSIAIWYSDDGTAWTRVPHDDTFGERSNDTPNGKVSSSGIGFVALGAEAIWTSADGVAWTRSEAPGWAVSDLSAADAGMLLVGAIGPDRGLFREAAWYSDDGQSWSAAAVETQPTSDRWWSRFIGVAHADDGYLALGVQSNRLVWFSEDGYSWTYRGGFDENDGYEREWLSDIAATGDTVIVAGARGAHNMSSGATLWISTDGGFTWSVVEECDEPAGIFGNARSETRNSNAGTIVAADGRLIVGGWFGGGTETDSDPVGTHDAAVWIGTRSDS